MLIVGTRGRSLGGFQNLVTTSFSKWCLQYSPIPVVVVRPTEKREKKKKKRLNDPARQNYAQILQDNGQGIHEANVNPKDNTYEPTMLPSKGADAEAHAVAEALELPAHFDPTIKPYKPGGTTAPRRKNSTRSDATEASTPSPEDHSPDSRPNSPGAVMKSPGLEQLESPDASDAEESGDDEFEVTPGTHFLGKNGNSDRDKFQDEEAQEKMKRLHDMEKGEALALGRRKESADDDDVDGEEAVDTLADR